MSENDPASPAVAHTSPSETPNVDPSHTDIENQSPKNPYYKLVHQLICWMTIGETNLENFRAHVKDEGWKGSEGFRDAMTQMTTIQGLVLAVCAAFLTTVPPVETIDYARRRCYTWLLWSFACSVWGLICQLMFLRINMSLSMQDTLDKHITLSPSAIGLYLLMFSLPYDLFLLSLLFLASAIIGSILGNLTGAMFLSFAAGASVASRFLGGVFIQDAPEAYIKWMSMFAILVCVVVVAFGIVCDVHINGFTFSFNY